MNLATSCVTAPYQANPQSFRECLRRLTRTARRPKPATPKRTSSAGFEHPSPCSPRSLPSRNRYASSVESQPYNRDHARNIRSRILRSGGLEKRDQGCREDLGGGAGNGNPAGVVPAEGATPAWYRVNEQRASFGYASLDLQYPMPSPIGFRALSKLAQRLR